MNNADLELIIFLFTPQVHPTGTTDVHYRSQLMLPRPII